ncbi:hypothetical protein LTR87_003032 [Friedmanniomyces endolithicus]|nr:hypothetical protein LTR87_003032 [Friedmanniomyces endolithicus]
MGLRQLFASQGHKYVALGEQSERPLFNRRRSKSFLLFITTITLVGFAALVFIFGRPSPHGDAPASCDTIYHGYQCQDEISHYWGQYSPYFSVPSDISDEVPNGCSITFAQILSRHGARDPTASKTAQYHATIHKLQGQREELHGAICLSGRLRVQSGRRSAYRVWTAGDDRLRDQVLQPLQLIGSLRPFVRSSGQARVVESAQNWNRGFHAAKVADQRSGYADAAYPYPIVVIPETDVCNAFENVPDGNIASDAQAQWAAVFISPIQTRINAALPGANLTVMETVHMMDLCPFNTVASPNGTIPGFCALFTEEEWHQYGYYQTLNKYYGFSHGNPLGPTQGVGFSNELIARLTSKSVDDESSTNHTLDGSNDTFPLGRRLYADFSHDNDMTGIFSALGLYNGTTGLLPNTTITEAPQANGYSAAWTVPFAARAYFEKMQCRGQPEELVRVIVNDRVLPLTQCDGDRLGRCTLDAFVDSLGFVRGGGDWGQCFVGNYASHFG